MSRFKRMVSLVMSLLLVASSLSLAVYADDTGSGDPLPPPMIDITSDWKGSVFGNIGGQSHINADNFRIAENGDGTVTIKSSGNRGKVNSTTEGIAYYYKQIPSDTNYELSATVYVDNWTANNEVSFGIMARSNVLENTNNGSFTGQYVAVGAVSQQMMGFYKEGSSYVNSGYEMTASGPAQGQTYQLSLKKTGDVYLVQINGETREITFNGVTEYVGLYTSRNATATFSDIKLNILPTEKHDDWQFASFGESTGAADTNPDPTIHEDGSVTLIVNNDKGKLAGSNEGISFYFTELLAGSNFEIKAKVSVGRFDGSNGQRSFGLMIKDEIGIHRDSTRHTSPYVAVGALKNEMKALYKDTGNYVELESFNTNIPKSGETYDLSIRKTGDAYVMTVNGESQTIAQDGVFSGTVYVGFYVARDAEVTFSDFSVIEDQRITHSITADASRMNTQYLVGESLDLSGLQVTASVTDAVYGSRNELLSSNEYAVTGFDSSVAGSNTITVHFQGYSDEVDLTIIALTVTSLEIVYPPAKTEYYIGDTFDPEGLTLHAEYNSGASGILTPDKYEFSIPGATLTGDTYTFTTAGTHRVDVISTETPAMSVSFDVEVKEAQLEAIEISQLPAKTQYFLGDPLDLSGIIVYAIYDDGSSVRLLRDELNVSGFDSSAVGDKTLTVSYNGKSDTFDVNVKEKEVTHLEVTQYPKTTYALDEAFDTAGLIISKVYDNDDREVYTDFTLDTTGYDSSQPGVYEIRIIPQDGTLEEIVLSVIVRESQEPEWHSIRFGQSTSDANNKVTVLEDGTIRLEALGGSAGKVTGDHDGISYYYTVIDAQEDNFVLSADIKVIEYAKENHDGQESFGIMARDVIGPARDSSIFASNIAAVGGFSGGTRNDNGTQLFARTGVEAPDGTGSQGITRIMLKNERPGPTNTHPAQPYRLTLAKTNSGFVGKLNDGAEEILFLPDILTVQDSEHIYVGFYAARLATIEVSNIAFSTTAAATDAPRVEPPPFAMTPSVEILSLANTSDTDYTFRASANVAGAFTLKQGSSTLAMDISTEAGDLFSIPTELAANAKHAFSLTFIPDDTQLLTSYDRVVTNFTVDVRTYRDGEDIYVAPHGAASGDGTVEHPLDLDTAVAYVQPGQKIIVQEGHYVRDSKLEIKKYNDGREDAMKMLHAAEGTRPVIDFDKKSEGVVHSGNYWHVKGLDFARSADNTKGYTVGGSHNIIELSKFYEHGDTGLQISRTDGSNNIEDWPSYNLILNNESFDNADPSHNNADGFAAKLTSGIGNVFRGNVAHHNIDDGWDLYTKAGQGAIGAVIIEDSIAYANGTLTDGTVGSGDKNGFKLGGEGIHVPHVIRNSIAFDNGAVGFTSNSNPGVIAENNISFNNGGANLNLTTYSGIQEDFSLSGFISYRTEGTAKDNVPDRLKTNSNYLFDGTQSINASGVELSDENFASLAPDLPFTRDEDGNLVLGDFLRFIAPKTGGGGGTPPSVAPGAGGADGTAGDTDATEITEQADGSITLKPAVQVASDGTASVSISDEVMQQAIDSSQKDEDGRKRIRIEAAADSSQAASAYNITLPASVFDASSYDLLVELNIGELMLIVNSDMFGTGDTAGSDTITFHIQVLQPEEHGVAQLGDRPTYRFRISAGDEATHWDNPQSSVEVEIPYELAADEVEPELLVVWYIDDAGVITPVVNSRYDEAWGAVVFTTTHFSQYAITYHPKTFADLAEHGWAKHGIDVLAARGIINGVSETSYAPASTLTRADYALLLVRALELQLPVGSEGQSFTDVQADAYYADGIAIASALGIVEGSGDGRFMPTAAVSRQEMFVMAWRALRAAGLGEGLSGEPANLITFPDHNLIAPYAQEAITAFTESGLILGDRHGVRPLDSVTRAEAAVFIYRLYNIK